MYLYIIYIYIHKYTWNPNDPDPCFDWKRSCLGGVKAKNRGQQVEGIQYRIFDILSLTQELIYTYVYIYICVYIYVLICFVL